MKLTGAEIVCETLTRLASRHVFGYPGGAILPIYDALGKSKLHHILVRHEQGATHMADGYARASGGVGVAMATSGPGATNMVTGIATAMLDSSPVVCITGQVSSKLLGSDAFQEVDITGITMPITKHNVVVSRAEDVARTIREAFVIAQSGRPGPVLVDITKDAQQATCEFNFDAAAPKLPTEAAAREATTKADFDRAVEMLNSAKRPLILAGHGIMMSGAMKAFDQFVHTGNIPVAMTLLGIGGFPANDPLNLGMMGMHGEAWVNHAIQEADLLIAVGMRFDDRVTGDLKTYARDARKIHIEIDRSEINKNVKVDSALVGDAREVLEALLPHIKHKEHADWLAHIRELKGDSAVRDIQGLPDNGHLYAAHVINDLWKETHGDAIVVTDVGQHQMWEAQYYHHNRPRSLMTSGGLGTMGFAMPAAIGAKFARARCGCLGGGRRRRIPDDHVRAGDHRAGKDQGQDRHHQQRISGHGAAVAGIFLRQALRGDAAGCAGFCGAGECVRDSRRADYARGEVIPTIRAARESKESFLIDFRVEQEDSVYPMVPAGGALHEMIRRPDSPLVETAATEL